MVNDMDWVWKRREDGFTKANGLKVSKDVTVFVCQISRAPATKVHGPMGFRMVMESKSMPMEVFIMVRYIKVFVMASVFDEVFRTVLPHVIDQKMYENH